MKSVAIGFVLVLAGLGISAHAEEPAGNRSQGTPGKIKVGDRISYERQKYTQPDPFGDIVLDGQPTKGTYTLELDDGQQRGFKYRNGVTDLYDPSYALIGTIQKSGETKLVDPEAILRWMPKEGLQAGMSWKIETAYFGNSSGLNKCKHFVTYAAKSTPASRDIKIAGALTHIEAIEVTLDGADQIIGGCKGQTSRIEERIVYSKDLDLVVEKSYVFKDDFKHLRGTNNRIDTVTAIN